MNVQNLRENYPKLISYLETNDYSKSYLDSFKREIEKILTLVDSKEWSCYTDVYLDYTKTPHSPGFLRYKRTIIGAIEQFDVHADTRMEDAGMNFSKGGLIPCCHRNSNPSSTFTVKWK